MYFLIWGASTEQNVCSLTNFLNISIPLHSKCLRAIELTFSIFTRQHSEQNYALVNKTKFVVLEKTFWQARRHLRLLWIYIYVTSPVESREYFTDICNSHYMTDQNYIFKQNSIFLNRFRMSVALNAIQTVDIELTYFENDDENVTQK